MSDSFEERIRELTKPINGQLPRPWMTEMTNPQDADVFIVGMNQSKKYCAEDILHQRHIDALFNRNEESCRGLYNWVTNGKPSLTRRNTDDLVGRLNQRGIHNILETNVVCYSTGTSTELRTRDHAEGARRGKEIFQYLLDEISPAILIVHGAGSLKQVSSTLRIRQLTVPKSADEICDVQAKRHLVIPVPSLGPPEFYKWSSWSNEYLDMVADRVRSNL